MLTKLIPWIVLAVVIGAIGTAFIVMGKTISFQKNKIEKLKIDVANVNEKYEQQSKNMLLIKEHSEKMQINTKNKQKIINSIKEVKNDKEAENMLIDIIDYNNKLHNN